MKGLSTISAARSEWFWAGCIQDSVLASLTETAKETGLDGDLNELQRNIPHTEVTQQRDLL
jgi:hypothetical protein